MTGSGPGAQAAQGLGRSIPDGGHAPGTCPVPAQPARTAQGVLLPPVRYTYRGRARSHAGGGEGTTPVQAVRVVHGDGGAPDPISHDFVARVLPVHEQRGGET